MLKKLADWICSPWFELLFTLAQSITAAYFLYQAIKEPAIDKKINYLIYAWCFWPSKRDKKKD